MLSGLFWALDVAPDPVPLAADRLSAALPVVILALAVAAGYLIARSRRRK